MSPRAIVLAAGKGTRMKSMRPKVLHPICGRPMLWWCLEALRSAGVAEIALVVSPEMESLLAGDEVLAAFDLQTVVQTEPAGTGDAVRVALRALPAREGTVIVSYGDMPLVDEALLRAVAAAQGSGAARLALVTARMPLPSGFGRIVREGDRVARIVEARDCSPDELALDEMNAGIYAFDEPALRDTIARIGSANAQDEYYLTDTVALLAQSGQRVVPLVAPEYATVLGINDRAELALARAALNARLCRRLMHDGVTIVDPASTYLEPGVRIGQDTVVYPGTTIGRGSSIGRDCSIGPNARLEAATVGDGVRICESIVLDSFVGSGTTVGPFAHLRGGSRVGDRVRIGNYVELKNANFADDVKANHLSYVGDARVGLRSNIGAGTITANFDGQRKNRTEIGADVKIGTNTSIVAPVSIGDDVVTGAGTVVIRDLAAGARVVGNPARPIVSKTSPG